MRRKQEWGKHKEKRHVVFFGKATFGHGKHGPCARKGLLRSIRLLAPVVLIDEYNTSKCWHGCGTELEQINGSCAFLCPKSQTDENLCPIGHIDRDVNGTSNIANRGVYQLLGTPSSISTAILRGLDHF